MPATEAQILANRKNAANSTGPKTPEGKLASRANAVSHGLTARIVFPTPPFAPVTATTFPRAIVSAAKFGAKRR